MFPEQLLYWSVSYDCSDYQQLYKKTTKQTRQMLFSDNQTKDEREKQ